MKALVYYGPKDMKLSEIDDLKPAKGEVLIKIKANGICGSDVHGYLGMTGRRTAPMVMGHEFAGQVEFLGEDVKTIKVGDRVTAHPGLFCGECEFCKQGKTNVCPNKKFYGVMDFNGSMAEYLCVPEDLVFKLPDNVSYTLGAMVEPLAVSYSGVSKAKEISGKNVLIVGAGTIGLLALAVVKTKNPAKVFISDMSDDRLEVAKKMGADIVINPSKQDIKEIIDKETNKLGVDLAIECVGISPTVQQAMSSLKIGGMCIWIGNSAKMIEMNMQDVVTRELNVSGSYIYTFEDFKATIDLLSKGEIDITPVISLETGLENGVEYFNKLATDPQGLIKVVLTD